MNEGSTDAGRDLRHVGDLVDGVVAALGERVGLGGDAVLWSEWRSISGDDWVESVPVRLKNGILSVTVSDGITATRLRYATTALIERIEARIGPDIVSTVRLQIERKGPSR